MEPRFAAVAVGAVLLYDLVASVASRALGFPYGRAALGSYVVYFLVGVWTARSAESMPLLNAAIVVALAGLADASLGWALSWQIGPGRPAGGRSLTLASWARVAIMVVVMAAAIGTFGGVVGRGMRPSAVAVP